MALISAALMVPWMNAEKNTTHTNTQATIDIPSTAQCYRLLMLISHAWFKQQLTHFTTYISATEYKLLWKTRHNQSVIQWSLIHGEEVWEIVLSVYCEFWENWYYNHQICVQLFSVCDSYLKCAIQFNVLQLHQETSTLISLKFMRRL